MMGGQVAVELVLKSLLIVENQLLPMLFFPVFDCVFEGDLFPQCLSTKF